MRATRYSLKTDDSPLREDLRELARLALKLYGDTAAPFAARRAGELRASGHRDAAEVWDAVALEIEELQSREPESGSKH